MTKTQELPVFKVISKNVRGTFSVNPKTNRVCNAKEDLYPLNNKPANVLFDYLDDRTTDYHIEEIKKTKPQEV